MKKDGLLYEYQMSKDYANSILRLKKKDKSKKDPQPYLCDFVNQQMGLRGTCVKVVIV